MPCGKWDTGSNECHETLCSGVKSLAVKKMCGDVVSGTWALESTYTRDTTSPLSNCKFAAEKRSNKTMSVSTPSGLRVGCWEVVDYLNNLFLRLNSIGIYYETSYYRCYWKLLIHLLERLKVNFVIRYLVTTGFNVLLKHILSDGTFKIINVIHNHIVSPYSINIKTEVFSLISFPIKNESKGEITHQI